MHQIAKLANVSLGTVSNVMNDSAVVRESLRKRVLDAVAKLGYQPSQLARALRTNSSSMIGMIIPDIANPFFPAVVRGVEDIAYQNSYRLVLCNTDNDPLKEKSYIHELKTYLPAGLIIIPTTESNFEGISDRPIVCVDRKPKNWTGDMVTVANEEGCYQATKHLLRSGHKKIGMISGPSCFTNAVERLAGFRRALREEKITIAPEYIQESAFSREGGHTAALRLLRLIPRPTAIVAGNDLIALGALSAIRELGLKCPQDVSIIGFDALEFTEFTEPALTSVYQSGYQLGSAAARVLLDKIANPDQPAQSMVLDVELRVRNSVSPVEQNENGPKKAIRSARPRNSNRSQPAARPKVSKSKLTR